MFQTCFGLGARVLPWRRPEYITGAGSLQASGGAGGCAGSVPHREPEGEGRAFIDAIFRMNRALGIPERFPCIRPEDLPQMAAWAEAEANPVYPVPVIFSKEDFIRVARRVMP